MISLEIRRKQEENNSWSISVKGKDFNQFILGLNEKQSETFSSCLKDIKEYYESGRKNSNERIEFVDRLVYNKYIEYKLKVSTKQRSVMYDNEKLEYVCHCTYCSAFKGDTIKSCKYIKFAENVERFWREFDLK